MTSKFPKIATNSDSLSSNATAVVPYMCACNRVTFQQRRTNLDCQRSLALSLSRARSLAHTL